MHASMYASMHLKQLLIATRRTFAVKPFSTQATETRAFAEAPAAAESPAVMSTLAFAVRRREPELVGPAAPTPRDTKRLSDMDDQAMLHRHVRLMFFYHCGSAAAGDPAAAIRRALGAALVPYYPLAGRLRELEDEPRKLVVDCTGEGVMFVEADADVRLAELEAAAAASSAGGVSLTLTPPFPCVDQLLFDVDGSSGGVLGCPLLLFQVTRLLCGGFVVGIRLNHTMCDAHGVAQFVSAVADLARGLPAPTVAPVWSREVLEARTPPEPPAHHRQHDVAPPVPPPPPPAAAGDGDGDMVVRTFTFATRDVAAIKRRLPRRLRGTATSYEALVAALWRARTAALEVRPGDETTLVVVANCRGVRGLGIPDGYYGNAVAFPVARAAAGALLATAGAGVGGSSLSLGLANAVELVREAKALVTAEYVRSVVDLLAVARRRGWPPELVTTANVFAVSDNRHAGFHRVDFGWGAPVFGGVVTTVFGASFLVAVRRGGGEEEAVAVPIVLPRPAMERFASEVEMTLACHAAAGSAAPPPPPRGRL